MLTEDKSSGLCEKWNPILEGIEDSYVRETTAVLLENQARAIMTEYSKENLTEATTSVGSLGSFQKFAFPLVRRVFPELIANKIAGVQPMQGPVSQIFYLGYSRDVNGRTVENVYSKYNMTYAGRDAGPNASLGVCAIDAAGGSVFSGHMLSSTALTTHASATAGGKIAAWPDAQKTFAADVSSAEALTGNAIPEISMHIENQAVVARTRKFRALWTLEASQDLRAYHNLDMERELTDLLGKEVSLEIDRELIEDIRNIAYDRTNVGGFNRDMLNMKGGNVFSDDGTGAFNPGRWSYDLPGNAASDNAYAGTGQLGADPKTDRRAGAQSNIFVVDFGSSALNLTPRHLGEVYSNLVATLQFASQDIYKTTYRAAGNFVVTSPMVAAMLYSAAKLEGGMPNEEIGKMGQNITYKGKFLNQFDVYIDPLYPEDELLVGYKGGSPMDAGYMYCPYIPLQMLPTITDPDTFQPRKGLITRYGKAAITPEARFYRIIRIIGGVSNFMERPFGRLRTTA